jgi:hypothetical protein
MASSSTSANATAQHSNTSVDTPTSATGSTVSALEPDGVSLTIQYINDDSWPSDFKLDTDLANWEEWIL